MYANDINAASSIATLSAPSAASRREESLPSRRYAASRAAGRPILSLSGARSALRPRSLQLSWIGLIRR